MSRLNGLSFTRQLSGALGQAGGYTEAAAKLAAAALALEGVHGVRFRSDSEAPAWLFRGDDRDCETVAAEVRAGHTVWGSLEIMHRGLIDARGLQALTTYAAEQLALALRRIGLMQQNAALRAERNAVGQEIHDRIVLQRAVGIVGAQYNIAADKAERLMRHHARNSGRTTLQLAEALVTRAQLGRQRKQA